MLGWAFQHSYIVSVLLTLTSHQTLLFTSSIQQLFIQKIGTYNPIATNAGIKEIRLKADRIRYWISVGAQPSDRVAWLLGKFGILPPPPQRYSVQKMVPKKDRVKEES